MDYFFQEQRWTDTFLSLHVNKVKRIFLLLLIAFSAAGAEADDVPSSWQNVTFNENIRYSQWVINSRISDFYGNKDQRGFNIYNETGTKISDSKGTQVFDYVPGLVAKAILEAYANYSTFDWSKPWFYSVMNYAKDKTYKLVATETQTDFSGITLDNMNACKMYFPLMATGALSDGAKTIGETAIANVLTDMKKYNSVYAIGTGSESGVKNSTNDKVKSMFGGWFHKPAYKDQMWCDGLYMGAALLAQIIKYKDNVHNITASSDTNDDWDLIAKQFTISWTQLYNSSKGLLYHAFTANPKDDASSAWSGISNTTGSEVYHSEAFWGRAIGWYFLALVDVLEQMPSNNSNYSTLKGYLDMLAAGLAKYQDATTGCWYQVIDEKDVALTGNYLESSCTSLFAAAYLKACRLNLLTDTNYKTIGENAFKGAVAQFMKCDTYSPGNATTVQLVHNCKSAGLGGNANRSGSRSYYITGSDVGQSNTYTEGKVMGAFIMAATEYEKANAKAIRFSYDLAPAYTLSKGQSLKVEALGSGEKSVTYQWYKKEGTTSTAVTDAKKATFAPATSGSYYCEATTTQSGVTTTIKTSPAAVTVSEAPTEATSPIVWTFTSSTINGTLGTAGNSVTFTSTDGSQTVMTYVSGSSDEITTSSQTINGVAYSSYLKENGNGTATGNRRMEFNAPSSKGTVTVVYAATAGSTKIVDGSNGNTELASLTGTVNTAVTSSEISTTIGNKIIIFCPSKSYIYSVIWTPTESTSGGGTNEFTVTLNATGVTGYPQSITYSGTALVLPTPVKTGYTFDGWYTAETGGTKEDSPYTPTADVTLYAHYTEIPSGGGKPTVTIDGKNETSDVVSLSGGSWSGSGTTAYYGLGSAGSFTIASNNSNATISKIVLTYTENKSDRYGGTVTVNSGTYSYYSSAIQGTWTGSANSVTFTTTNKCRIKTIEVTYSTGTSTGHTITYNMNGHGENIREVTGATALPNPLPTPTEVVGYTFGGWYTDANCNTAATAGATISAPITLYAKWTKNKYTVTANATNGTVTITDGNSNTITSGSEVEHGKQLTFKATPSEGYVFSSWTVNGATASEAGNVYTISSLTEATTVTANFTAPSSGGGAVNKVIYFTSGTTSSNENVLKVIKGSQKTGSSVTYNDTKYSNGVKMESSTDISLTLTAESDVTFVFDTPNKDFKVGETTYTTGSDGTCKITLQPGKYSIRKVDTSVALYAVDIKSTGSSISFTTQPEDAEYLKGATSVTPLTVEAQVNNVTGTAPAISYQWYKNTENSTESGSEIKDATEASYTPVVTTAGTTYYYCKATAKVGDEKLSANSTIAIVTVNEASLTIETQPVGATYALNQTGVEPLIVVAKTNTSNEITYQWYKNSNNSTEGAAEITGQTSSEYTPAVTALGTTYYYCEVKAGELKAKTDIVAVIVNNDQPIYGYKVPKAGIPAPGINTSMYINTKSDGTGENLVKMTFGGWKWSDGKYVKPNSETEITDTWKESETVSGVTVLDGYNYWFSGTQDAVQEDKTAETEMYGHTRYGWFVSPTRDANGVTTESHPYTLPVRGSFMTFEPTKNGTLTIYILQNGAWNTFDKATTLDGVSYAKGAIKPGEFRMHAFQVTNQRGLVLAEFAPKYTVTNKQKVASGYSCTKYADSDKPKTFDNTSKDISDWKEFWDLEPEERQAVRDNWSVESNDDCQEIIKLKNGSFLAIQKAVVKYQFHVTGNETYYFFSNFSKMGFSGATFQPDGESGQPKDETTFSGDSILSDTKAFPTIGITEVGTIEGTDMTNYNYTINGKEFVKVDGVFIPQFKEITLNREFKKDRWTTLTLPFNLMQSEVEEIFGVGTRLIVLDKGTNNSGAVRLKFVYHEIQNVLPGYPYLIKPTQDVTTFTVNNKCINPHISQLEIDCGDYIFKGVTGYCTPEAKMQNYSVKFAEGDIFVSNGDGKLYISGGNSYSKGYRAYIKKKPRTPAAKSISIVMNSFSDDDDTTTSIDVAEFDPTLLESLGLPVGVYNLNGQRVGNDTRNLRPGIYIVNGKKTVVK